jgi:Holliday junction resolvase
MRAAKVDANQREIVQTLRNMGASVQPLHTVGQGVPDLLVAIAGFNVLIEVKDGEKPPSQQKLTPDQIDWHSKWKAPVYIVNSVAQVIDLVQKIKQEES